MKSKIIKIIIGVLAAFGLVTTSTQVVPNFGASQETHSYKQASSTRIVLVADAAYRAIATSSSADTATTTYDGKSRRDYLYFKALSKDTYCSLEQGKAATMSDFSFVIGSTSPEFIQEVGVYNGAVSCISPDASVFVVTEHNY